MTYQEAVDYLFSLGEARIKPGLSRITEALTKLGEPQKGFPQVVIGGTNGKGSVIAMMGSVLSNAGYRIGRFTSPHLFRYEERIRVGGDDLPARLLPGLVEDVRKTGVPLTYFEFAAACALLHFSRMEVDLSLLEVGLGGRWDATNATCPILSVITSISRDHMEWLGDSIEQIAWEKAFIMREAAPVVLGSMPTDAMEVILKEASGIGAHPKIYKRDFSLVTVDSVLSYSGPDWKIDGIALGLEGEFQVLNAACAIAALEELAGAGYDIGRENVLDGLAEARWPGRLERIPAKPGIIVDSAHNQDAVRALSESLKESKGPRVWLFSALKDKDIAGMAGQVVGDMICIVPLEHPRSADVEMIRDIFEKSGTKAVASVSLEEGLARARAEAGKEGTIVVAGSVYLAAAVLAELSREAGEGS
ncbi:MAG: folylpolyglutamate synthase/dihydrofolate synthase family protein [bacterium]